MQKEKILVIDDEEFILQLAQDILTKANHEIKMHLMAIRDWNCSKRKSSTFSSPTSACLI